MKRQTNEGKTKRKKEREREREREIKEVETMRFTTALERNGSTSVCEHSLTEKPIQIARVVP